MLKHIKPQYFDLLGVVTFPFVFFYALYEIVSKQTPALWVSVIMLLVGVGGVIIDGQIVWHYFVKKDLNEDGTPRA